MQRYNKTRFEVGELVLYNHYEFIKRTHTYDLSSKKTWLAVVLFINGWDEAEIYMVNGEKRWADSNDLVKL